MILGLGLALVACLLYGFATLVQAVGSKKAEGMGAFLQPLVIIGLALDGVAFLVSLVAYDHAPLFVVQTIIAAAVVVSVLGAPRFIPGVSLRPIDMVGAGIVLVGLVVIAGAAGKEKDTVPGGSFMTVLLVVAAVLLVATALAYKWAPAWLMATLSGLGFSLVAIGARSAETDGTLLGAILHPVALVVLGGGAVGVIGNIRALEKGSVAIAASIVSLLEVVIPSIVGITLLGDTVRPGWDVALVAAIAVALGGCGLLAASPANKAAEG